MINWRQLVDRPNALFYGLLGTLVAIMLIFAIWGESGLYDYIKLRGQFHTVEQQNHVLLEQNLKLNRRIHELADPQNLRRELVTNMGMVKEGDVVIVVDPSAQQATQAK